MSEVQSKFLDALARQFPLPTGMASDPKGWADDYEEALKSFSADTLENAAKQIIRERDKRSYPLPAECRKVCNDVLEAACLRAQADKKIGTRRSNDPAFEDWRRKSADKLFSASKYNQRALKEDWAWTFHTWLVNNQRNPDEHEVAKIRQDGIQNSKRFWDLLSIDNELVDKLKPNFFAKKYLKWREIACDRLKKIASGVEL